VPFADSNTSDQAGGESKAARDGFGGNSGLPRPNRLRARIGW
jgi:hypothetical protein